MGTTPGLALSPLRVPPPCSFPSSSQVEVARKHIAYHMEKFGYRKPNVDFLQGYMEKLGDAGLADESYDIVM